MRTEYISASDKNGYMWEGSYQLEDDGSIPDGGIVLNDLMHAGYSMATEVKVMGFWVEFEQFSKQNNNAYTSTGKEKIFYPLTKHAFNFGQLSKLSEDLKLYYKSAKRILKAIGDIFGFRASKIIKDQYLAIMDELQNFSGFNFIYGLRAEYETENMLIPFANCECSGLKVTQTYLFSDYKNSPAHEPGGVLNAARFHPLIKTEFVKNQSLDKHGDVLTRVNSIRVDYKFKPKLDAFIYIMENNKVVTHDFPDSHASNPLLGPGEHGVLTSETDYVIKNKPQQAGVFTDSESAGPIDSLSRLSLNPEDLVFNAVEKPLVFPNVAVGLLNGFNKWNRDGSKSFGNNKSYHGWDNIHWWGGYKNFHIPSAPGAFHALHLHWRWGKSTKGNALVKAPEAKQKQFKGKEGLGGPLVDPKCWIQTIRFAITPEDSFADQQTTRDFETKFEGLPLTDIKDGTGLELWFCVERFKTATERVPVLDIPTIIIDPDEVFLTGSFLKKHGLYGSLDGTVFIHGMFFAHEPEKVLKIIPERVSTLLNMLLRKTGNQGEKYFPDSEEKIRAQRKLKRNPFM